MNILGTYSNDRLVPGDLGTVITIDNAGGIQIIWDNGSSRTLVYKEDLCKYLMTKKQMEIGC